MWFKYVFDDYKQTSDEDEFIQGLRTFAKYFGDKQERDRSGNKQAVEETFGGIWIEDTEEFAKFVSAANTYPTDENGEGIAKTSDYFYLYYRSIDDRLIPFLSVYLNKEESQEIIKQLKEEYENAKRGNKGVQEHLNRGISRAWNIRGKNSGNISNSSGSSFGRRNGVVGSDILRKGKYFDNPSLYVKVKRTDGRGKVSYSLITPEMNATYLDAVERGKDGKWRYEVNDGVFLLCLLLIVMCYDCVTKDDSTVDLIDYGKRSDFSHVFTLLYNVLIYSVLGSM